MTGRAKHPGTKKDRPRGVIARAPRLYRRTVKSPAARVCSDCGLVEHRGRWSRGVPAAARLTSGRCPACLRVRERSPAGTLRLPPRFLAEKREVLRLLGNLERAESAEHPLERLMDVEESDGWLVVTTTGVHLARLVAHQLAKRFHRRPRYRYARGEDEVFIDWAADAVAESTGRAGRA